MMNICGNTGELGTSLEVLNSDLREVFFEENELSHLEDVLRSEGIEMASDFEGMNMEQLIDAIDNRVRSLKPEFSSNCHMSHFGKESDVWKEFRSRLEPKYLEAPSDKIQQEQIATAMCEMGELRFDEWKQLTLEGKVSVLNKLENQIAKIEHRPSMLIKSEGMDEEGLLGYQLNDAIAINEKLLMASDSNPIVLEQLLETLIHEGRHAYQQYNVDERMVHQSKAQVESWRENIYDLKYWDGEAIKIPIIGGLTYSNASLECLGARLYHYQPIEIDARVFAADTMSSYRKHLKS